MLKYIINLINFFIILSLSKEKKDNIISDLIVALKTGQIKSDSETRMDIDSITYY
jgi:enolase